VRVVEETEIDEAGPDRGWSATTSCPPVKNGSLTSMAA